MQSSTRTACCEQVSKSASQPGVLKACRARRAMDAARPHLLNYQWLAISYFVFSAVGFSLFLAFGYTYTKSGDKLKSLSHLITATSAIEALFSVFLALHGLLAMLYYALLLKYCDRVPNWAAYLISVCIFIFTLLTGEFATLFYDNAHFAFATLAFASTAIAGALIVWTCEANPLGWKAIGVKAAIVISGCLLVVFAILAHVSTAKNEGPLEWTSIYLLTFVGLALYFIVRDENEAKAGADAKAELKAGGGAVIELPPLSKFRV